MSTLGRVKRCVGEVLALDASTIHPGASLIEDLGADSLDLVELMYLLEKEFSIRLEKQDISLSAQLGLSDEETHQEEILTPRALELLRGRHPESAGRLREGMTRTELAVLLTVSEISQSIERKLDRAKT